MARRHKPQGETAQTAERIIAARRQRLSDIAAIRRLGMKLVSFGVLIMLIFSFALGIAVMPNDDMAPRISATDLVIYYRWDKQVNDRDVVVIEKDGRTVIARVVARGGDEVNITADGLVINGASQGEIGIFYETGLYPDGVSFPIRLKEDEIFVLGDNRQVARDSRIFGAVKRSEIRGKVFTLLRRDGF